MQLLGGYQRNFKTYEDLGMRPKLAEQWSALMASDKGFMIIAAMPEGGITTLTDVSLMETDRLLRDFASIEEEHHREREIENIEVTTYDAAKGETPAKIIPALIRKYPNVYVLREFTRSGGGQAAIERSARRGSAVDYQRSAPRTRRKR